jgi:tetraacyldisaccharide 4'-kinase
MLADLGATVLSARFPNHHHYRFEELTLAVGRARKADCAAIVTTEKDAVKLDPSWTGDFPVWILSVELEFVTGQAELEACLDPVVA